MKQIFDHQVTEIIHESSNSIIYRAISQKTGQSIILKKLREEYPSPQRVTGFQREYQILRSFQDTRILQAYDIKLWKNSLVIVMEDFGGQSLNRLITSPGLNVPSFLEQAIQMTEALSIVHKKHIIHKDINPSNILLNLQTGQIKLTDFGISTSLRHETHGAFNPNMLEGTLAYISPEQTGRMNRPVDYRSDLYSLGATFYFMLTGDAPFLFNDPMELVHAHIAKTPSFSDRPNIQHILSGIILRLMEKTAESRYQSALSLKHDLELCKTKLDLSQKITNFSLGQADHFNQFLIPSKLYGREKEIKILLDSFDRIYSGKSELIMVSGYSGIGKSAIVQEVHKPIVEKKGIFISGKFDQYKRNIPYSVFIQSFQSLLEQILIEPESVIKIWKDKILAAVGENGKLIIDVIPELAIVIGKQNAPIPLPSNEALNRFNRCFQNFISVFSAQSHPLVIFLDDLQWADLSSLKLIELLMSNLESRHLLMILSWRSNEVYNAHPLTRTIHEIEKNQVDIHSIVLEPLKEPTVNQMLVDTLHIKAEMTLPLATLVVKKTGGNPFFLKKLLSSLYDDGFITFDMSTLRWHWDLEKIKMSGISENVVEFMVGQIIRLKPVTQNILQLASILGSTFDLRFLSWIQKKSTKKTLADLWEAVHEELVIPLDNAWKFVSDTEIQSVYFRFAHDRIQQSAASLLSPDQTIEIHFSFGQLMMQYLIEPEIEEYLFEIINHLNQAHHFIHQHKDREKLRLLNLRAAKRAKLSLAYETEFNCLKSARSLLDQEAWEHSYFDTLDIYTEMAEAAYHYGDFSEMDAAGHEVLDHTKSILDRISIYCLQSDRCMAENRQSDGLEILLPALAELGAPLPIRPNMADVQTKLTQVSLELSQTSIESLVDRPLMTYLYTAWWLFHCKVILIYPIVSLYLRKSYWMFSMRKIIRQKLFILLILF
ncbi:hypothetical protein CCP4SC76_1710008 [Gammaproteobacteria bacterium]